MSIPSGSYYATYHGHEVQYLEVAHEHLRSRHRSIVFFAGDSSLDNKVWFSSWEAAVNGYEAFLTPPRMKTDVCYWLNKEAASRNAELACLNTAVEATALKDRMCCCLLSQDRFISNHITEDDYLIVSIAGNDIALKPLLCTIVHLAILVLCTPQCCIERYGCGCPPNTCINAGCLCCGLPGCLSANLFGWPPGMGYFIDLFGNQIQTYIMKIIGCRRPRKVLVCMIYYPDEAATGSWADAALTCLRYDQDPGKLQAAIRAMFNLAISRICIPGVDVEGFPLYEVLDGRDSSDYVARVEPSARGGKKMAIALLNKLLEQRENASNAPEQHGME